MWSMAISPYFCCVLAKHSSNYDIYVNVCSTEIMLLDDVVDSLLKTGYTIRDSKRNSAKLIEFIVSFKCCIWFILSLQIGSRHFK